MKTRPTPQNFDQQFHAPPTPRIVHSTIPTQRTVDGPDVPASGPRILGHAEQPGDISSAHRAGVEPAETTNSPTE